MEDEDEMGGRNLCVHCIGEAFLKQEVQSSGKRRKCFYCGKIAKQFSIEEIVDRIEGAFDRHFVRTAGEPDSFQYAMLADRESEYEWERAGEQTIYAIMNAAEIPEEAAGDLQQLLEARFSDVDADAMGDETEFAEDAYYEEKGPDGSYWQEEWEQFERSLKSEARFFSRPALQHLKSVFDGIADLRTRHDRPLIVEVGPSHDIRAFYRARVFQSDNDLEKALERPDRSLGSPPSNFAVAGRMNAHGISVFYGADDPSVAIAEVRPPVGSQVAVARFDVMSTLRLLDLTALRDVVTRGSIFDPAFMRRLERVAFLQKLSLRIARPVLPDDEKFNYLPTQAIADFLATENDPALDGILFPSVQAAKGLNVVLFHKAALVQALDIPPGTQIRARLGMWGADGWEDDYSVTEEVPESKVQETGEEAWPLNLKNLLQVDHLPIGDIDLREPTLQIDTSSIHVHRVQAVDFKTEEYPVDRHRFQKRDRNF